MRKFSLVLALVLFVQCGDGEEKGSEPIPIVQPTGALWFGHEWAQKGKSLPDGFHYTSSNNPVWLSVEEIRELVQPFEAEFGNQKE